MSKDAEEKIKGPFKFDYAWWDKNRPALLPSTGLGKALKAYQDAKKRLEAAPGQLDNYLTASKALADAEKARAAASKKCGSLFKKTKAALDNSDASLATEEGDLRSAVSPAMLSDVKHWVDRLTKNAELLVADQSYLNRLIDGVKKNDQDARKKAQKVVETEGDDAVRTIRPSQGSMADSMKRMRSRLSKTFPNEYAELDKIAEKTEELGEAFNAVNVLHAELRELLNGS